MSLPQPAPRTSLVIPAYNEERRIGELFGGIRHFDGELIVVCDGSDRTPRVVEEIAAARPDLAIRCLKFPHRLGKGGGVKSGLLAATAPSIGFFDADGSTPVAEMERLFALLGSADAVIGSRWMEGSDVVVRQDILRRIASRGFNVIIRVLFGLRFTDTQCGAKVFRKEALDAVLPEVVSAGFEFDVELLWRLERAGYTVVEAPIAWRNRGDSRVRSTDMARMLLSLARVRFGAGRGRRS
ncbi:MAG TPA: glycosyltransferase family 2 protein [Methanoregulaceae archaeon]|nr:glycosyltransferase family 2 protein [Methanoregulaceae archaeon]HPD76472.1 glycosyltransferase family 2 protein [Methanoregulaceae archaeon]HRY76332.1 glycosyltransferase family 2 protein [Methanoregulaceae archaeon]